MLPPEIQIKVYKNTFYWSIILFAFFTAYLLAWYGFYDMRTFLIDLEGTAELMIAVSFMFGTFTFYFDILDRYLFYRKYFGVAGFIYFTLFLLMLALLAPGEYLVGPLHLKFSFNFLLLFSTFSVLFLMFLISREYIIKEIGAKLWRNFLRTGYIIYAFLVPYNIINYQDQWLVWWQGRALNPIPPPSLTLVAVAFAVILFRLSVFPVRGLRILAKNHKPKSIISHTDHPHEIAQNHQPFPS